MSAFHNYTKRFLFSVIFLLALSTIMSSCTLFGKKSGGEESVSSDDSEEIFQDAESEKSGEQEMMASDTTSEANEINKDEDDFFSSSAAPANDEVSEKTLTDVNEKELENKPTLVADEKNVALGENALKTATVATPLVVATINDSKKNQKNITKRSMASGITAMELKKSKVKLGTEVLSYTVQKNETLMWIAFKLYGDYRMWRSLAKLNDGKTVFSEGAIVKYYVPISPFEWQPQGLPYLIKIGDTLGRISKNVYGTPKRWKLLWDNNKDMIYDPNLIFAGFTLYYKSLQDLASLSH